MVSNERGIKTLKSKISFIVRMFQDCYCRCIALLAITCCLFPLTGAQTTDPSEVAALRAIRSNLIDPTQYLNWTKGDPCLAIWAGVLCFNATAEDGFLHVQELQLLHKNLSGNLVPELGQLTRMEILDFMWNNISGSIPKEIGNMISLRLMLLNGNELSGSLPEEIGYLPNLERIQIDENQISGSLPVSFANLTKMEHFHMNNNSISGQIPPEFSRLTSIVHILLDNNNLSGDLPAALSILPNLLILQLDNNNFSGASIPSSYGNMKNLLKLSLRNCSLQGPLPDLSAILQLGYLDLSWNQLNGSIPAKQLSKNITTIDLSNNELEGSIPSIFTGLPLLQKLSLGNNRLNGSVPSDIWNVNLSSNGSLILDFQNNNLNNITGEFLPPSNVSITLQGNPFCKNNSTPLFCGPQTTRQASGNSANSTADCKVQSCPVDLFFEYNLASPEKCVCRLPIRVGYRLKSPGFSDFSPHISDFRVYLTSGLHLNFSQLDINSFSWEEGPRLRMYLNIFPSNSSEFDLSEIFRIRSLFGGWQLPDSDIFGPYELLNFTLLGSYEDVIPVEGASSKLSNGILAGIILCAIAGSVTCSTVVSILIFRRKVKYQKVVSRKRKLSNAQIKVDGVKDFTFQEMCHATSNFSNSMLVGQGGYGKVYKGILADGTNVAVKRAQEGSLQGSREFITEIELLSRLHHRNLVSLIGYCDEDDEQMLVYEFMPNGTLRDHLPAKQNEPLNFFMRLRIALGSAKGILYLHTEVDPPIFHRDIKASNILLDSKFVAKVADFGLSRLAPELDTEGAGLGYVSTVVKGTPGYLDPEYFLTHKLTDKSDVYSLGIVFLELLTGMLPISQGRNIVREVNIACQSGRALSVIDKDMGDYPSGCVERFLLFARRCCHDETDARPSVSEVVRELESIRLTCAEEFSALSVSMANDDIELITLPSSVPTPNTYLDSSIPESNFSNTDIPSVAPR